LNLTEYTHLINKPDIINDKHNLSLEKILDNFPYFQSARSLYLKGLYNKNSFKYNHELKVNAAYTTDRTILFDFITSESFTAIQKGLYEQKLAELMEIKVIDSEIVLSKIPEGTSSLEHSILTTINQSENTKKELTENDILKEKLDIGKPLEFNKDEKYSFNEWLQLAKIQPIVREKNINLPTKNIEIDDTKKKKLELIDKFIETNPKIPQIDKTTTNTKVFEPKIESQSYLMTETLAKVYLEQKKYDKAIQAYQILILKYPEKSSFFANRISDIQNLQKNN
jgi:tetratricopeptide (TPR) repeat protein